MNHLTDFQLNEYFDHALNKSTQHLVQSHLESCSDCRARLEKLTRLYSALDELKDVSVPHDLTALILEQLPTSKSRILNLFSAVQFGVALGTMTFIAMEVAQSVHIPTLSAFQFNASILESVVLIPKINFLQFPLLKIPQFDAQTLIAAISITVLGLIANILSFHERDQVRK